MQQLSEFDSSPKWHKIRRLQCDLESRSVTRLQQKEKKPCNQAIFIKLKYIPHNYGNKNIFFGKYIFPLNPIQDPLLIMALRIQVKPQTIQRCKWVSLLFRNHAPDVSVKSATFINNGSGQANILIKILNSQDLLKVKVKHFWVQHPLLADWIIAMDQIPSLPMSTLL